MKYLLLFKKHLSECIAQSKRYKVTEIYLMWLVVTMKWDCHILLGLESNYNVAFASVLRSDFSTVFPVPILFLHALIVSLHAVCFCESIMLHHSSSIDPYFILLSYAARMWSTWHRQMFVGQRMLTWHLTIFLVKFRGK